MPPNDREDDEMAYSELDLEIEPVLDDDAIDYTDDRIVELDEDAEDIELDLDALTALEGPDVF